MQKLSDVRKTSSCASPQPHLHSTRLAFLLLGAGSSGTSQESKGRFRVHLCSNRQVHQVDRIQTTRKIQRSQSGRVHPRYYAPLRHAQSNHHRFGCSLHSYRIQKLGTGLWLQYRLRISRTSRSQRTGRKGQWTHTSQIKTKII